MATDSMLKPIQIINRKMCREFVEALEAAKKTKGKDITLTRKCTEMTGDKVKEFFDE